MRASCRIEAYTFGVTNNHFPNMTESDLARIESKFAINLPEPYRSVMLAYPFATDSWANDCAMANDLETVMEMNQDRNFLRKFVEDPKQYFQIGSDGGETYYYIDLQNSDCPVYSFDVETGYFKQEAWNFKLWIGQLNDIDEEIRKDKIEMARKRWWQFWK